MDIVEVAVITTSLTTHKTGTGEGESLAPVQAQAHVPAHAQHTNARTFDVHLCVKRGLTQNTGRRYIHVHTQTQLVREIVHLHALGYKLFDLDRDVSGTYYVRIYKDVRYDLMVGYTDGCWVKSVWSDNNYYVPASMCRENVRKTREGRE